MIRLSALWNGQPTDRPCIAVIAPSDRAPAASLESAPAPATPEERWLAPECVVPQAVATISSQWWGGEAAPSFLLMAGWVVSIGGKPRFDHGTIWFEQQKPDFDRPPPFRHDPQDNFVRRFEKLYVALADAAGWDDFMVGSPCLLPANDLISMHMGPENFLVALMDEVARVEDRIRWEVYPRIILEILIIKMIDLAAGVDDADAARPAPAKSKAAAKPRPAPAAPEPEPANQPAPPDQEPAQANAEPAPEPDPEDPPEEKDPAQDGGFDAAWKSILQSIRKKNLPRYLVFADAAAHMPDENTIVLSYAPENRFKKESAQEKNYADLLRQAASEKFGRELRILFRIDRGGDDETPPHEAEERAVEPEPQPEEPEAQNLSLFEQINETFPNNKELS